MPRDARLYQFFLLLQLPLLSFAALPELSSIEPIEYDEAAQRLVASGDARLDYGSTRLTADRITYYKEYNLADATGDVSINHEGNRIVASRLSFDVAEEVFALDLFRAGQWPIYITGVSAGGTVDNVTMQGGTVYYGDPGPLTLSASSNRLQYVDDEYVKLAGTTLRVGRYPVFYLPGYTHYFGEAPFFLELGGGYSSDLGAYIQSTSLFPVASFLRAGANVDYYDERGVLAGPAAQYRYDSKSQRMRGAISTGVIDDRGDRGEDLFGRPIEAEREFAEWRHLHHIGERFTAVASASYWSDSEVTRDFRDDFFDDNQQPDNFAEAVYAGDNYLLSAFGRFRPNDFQLIQERLPELRFDLLPVPIFKTGAYHRLSASYGRLREDFSDTLPALSTESESDRADIVYRLERPLSLSPWLTLTPLVGGRWTQYDNQQQDAALGTLPDEKFSRGILEAGFDLEAKAYANYPTRNRIWGIDGLRHILRPVLRYRYHSDPDDSGEIVRIDREAMFLERPLLDLSDLRDVDAMTETHLARIGFENLFQTRAKDYGSRTLAALNFYQDVVFEKQTQFDGDEENTFNATWLELVLTPAPWLKFDLASRFDSESMSLDELRTRVQLISGEIWTLGLATDNLNGKIDQYRIDFVYRFSERLSVLTDVRYDADSSEFTRAGFGLRTRVGGAWEVIYALTFREDARREGDLEFTVRFRLVRP